MQQARLDIPGSDTVTAGTQSDCCKIAAYFILVLSWNVTVGVDPKPSASQGEPRQGSHQ